MDCGLNRAWRPSAPASSDASAPLPTRGRGKTGRPGIYATWQLRLAAAVIDLVAMALVAVLLVIITNRPLREAGWWSEDDRIGIALFLSVPLWLVYFAWPEASRHQASLGKLLVGIKVTNLSGGRLSMGQAVGRFFTTIPSALIVLGCLVMLSHPRKQALHDQLVGTLVVMK